MEKLEEISDFKIFLNASVGHWKRCSRPHMARGPLFAYPCYWQITWKCKRVAKYTSTNASL